MGPSCGSFWRVVGPPMALVGLCLGSFSVSFGALVAFGVRVLRDVVDFSYHGGQVEASRSVSASSGGHFGAQKHPKTIENTQSSTKQETAQQAVSGQCRANMSSAEQSTAEQGNTAKHRKSTYSTAQHSTQRRGITSSSVAQSKASHASRAGKRRGKQHTAQQIK